MSVEALVGCRIVLRYHRSAAAPGPRFSDLVGELTELTEHSATVLTRRGAVTVDRRAIALLRPVAASRGEILRLAEISRRGWRAGEQVDLDGWLLCADRGWTGRANSVLPLHTPSRPLPELLAECQVFYAERGLPLQIQVPLPARGLLDAELAGRCWQIERPSVVLTAELAPLLARSAPLPDGYQVELADQPSRSWLAGYHYRGGALPDFAAELLARHDRVQFVTIRQSGSDEPAAVGRGAVDDGWLGLSSVEVEVAQRRRGLATAVLTRLAGWAVGRGASRCYLQVDQANQAALDLYTGLGFKPHHRYHYRVAPAAERAC